MSIQLVGVDKLLATLAAKAAAGEIAAGVGRDTVGQDVLTGARERVPVLTGHLRDSLTYGDGAVSTDVVYASQVEYGGLHNPPEPYLRPAADTVNGVPAEVAMKEIIDRA